MGITKACKYAPYKSIPNVPDSKSLTKPPDGGSLEKEESPLQPQSLPNLVANPLLIFRPPLPPYLSGFDIRWTLVIRFSQHAHNGDQDLLDALDGRPSFRGVFVVIRVVAGWVEDRYTNCAIRVHYSTHKHIY